MQRKIVASLFFLYGVLLALSGGWLVLSGGAFDFLIEGILIAVNGILLFRGSTMSLNLYLVILAGSVIWSLSEVGFDLYQLVPRFWITALFGPFIVYVNRRQARLAQ